MQCVYTDVQGGAACVQGRQACGHVERADVAVRSQRACVHTERVCGCAACNVGGRGWCAGGQVGVRVGKQASACSLVCSFVRPFMCVRVFIRGQGLNR